MSKKILRSAALFLSLTLLAGCVASTPGPEPTQVPAEKTTYVGEVEILLSDDGILADGQPISQDENNAVYTARDIVYYEERDTYDSGNPYGEGTDADKHSAEEAAAHTVVHISQPGIYRISGTLSQGQIAVDLGDGAKGDPNAVVTLVLDGADITCTVAPAVIFYQVYECDTDWVAYDEGNTENYTASAAQDTASAGANVIVADGSVNNISGSYVARIYKDKEGEKKLHKYDGAFYSKMSMNVSGETEGTGVLNITASNEGLDTELHLTINGGWVLATGSTMDWAESDSDQVTMNLQFAAAQGADEAIVVTDQKGKVVFAYDPDQDETTGSYNRAYQGAILSCPDFKVGQTYYVYVGGSVNGTDENGLYDPDTVTGFEGAERQKYTGTDVGMMFGGGFMGGQRPDEGMPPEGQEPPEGWEPGQMPGGRYPNDQGGQPQPGDGAEASVNFYLTDKVNAFSGICDETT